MKKNFINWRRQPFCSVLEIVCPAIVILLMCYLQKAAGDPKNIPSEALDAQRVPIYPGLLYDPAIAGEFGDGDWYDERQENDSLAAEMQDFVKYVNYEPFYGLNNDQSEVIDKYQRFYSADNDQKRFLDYSDFDRYL